MLLVYLTVAWIVGITLGRLLWAQGVMGCDSPALWTWGATAAIVVLAAILLRRRKNVRLTLVLLLFTLLGAWRYQLGPVEPCFTFADLAWHNGTEEDPAWVAVEGVVSDYPDVRDQTIGYTLRAHTLELDGQRIDVIGLVLVKAPRYPEHRYGDELRVSGLLKTPPHYDGFSYREYLARKGIHSLIEYPTAVEVIAHERGSRLWQTLYAFRSQASDTINRIVPEPQASLLNGILLGIESGIPRQLYDDFNATGTSHIIVISGFNITIIVVLLSQTLGRLVGRRWAIYPVGAGILVYTLLVGADAAVVRAAIMGFLYAWAMHLGRQNTAFVSLSAASLVMTAINPLILWDTGFLLSVLATLGMILFTPAIQSWFQRLLTHFLPERTRQPTMSLLNDALVGTLAAQVTTVPLIAAQFGRLSLVSILTNLLILSVQPLIMICGGMATLAGLIWLPLGRVIGAVPWLFLAYTAAVVEWTARLPFASVDVGSMGATLALVYYVLLAGGLLVRQRWRRLERTARLSIGRTVAVAAGLMLPVWLAAVTLSGLPDGRLHVWYIGLGNGDATLIRTPSGRHILLDVGRGEGDVADAVAAALPGWGHRIDLLLLTQADQDHLANLPRVLDNLRVDQILLPASASVPDDLLVTTHTLETGTRVQLDEEGLLEVLHAPQGTDLPDNAVLRLSIGEMRLLLPPEIEQGTQASLLTGGSDLHSTVLKTPHTGTGNWPAVEFLTAVQPQSVIVPGGATYPPDVGESLQVLSPLYVDPTETVELITDGEQWWVSRRGLFGPRPF